MYSKSWQNTFSKLSNYMKTSKTVGTKDSNIKIIQCWLLAIKNIPIKVFLGIRIKYIFGLQMAGIRDQDDMFGVDVQEHGIMFQ